MTLFAAGARVSYGAPLCEHELQVGDDVSFANMATEVQKKSEFATGSTSAKSEAPPRRNEPGGHLRGSGVAGQAACLFAAGGTGIT
ncbi:MAG: hypothetical protein U1E15_08300 [Hyphomicrobiales bacterium]